MAPTAVPINPRLPLPKTIYRRLRLLSCNKPIPIIPTAALVTGTIVGAPKASPAPLPIKPVSAKACIGTSLALRRILLNPTIIVASVVLLVFVQQLDQHDYQSHFQLVGRLL